MFNKSNVFNTIATLFIFASFGFGQNSNANVPVTVSPRAMNAAANPAPTPRKSPIPRNANTSVNAIDSDYLPPTLPPANSTVRGRVYYSDTGRPVKRASIMLVGKEGGGREAAGLTDGEGMFEIKNIAAGTYLPIESFEKPKTFQ